MPHPETAVRRMVRVIQDILAKHPFVTYADLKNEVNTEYWRMRLSYTADDVVEALDQLERGGKHSVLTPADLYTPEPVAEFKPPTPSEQREALQKIQVHQRGTPVEWGSTITLTGGRCFDCRRYGQTARHHIVEIQNGGSNAVRNQVVLDFGCHKFLHPWLQEPPRTSGWTSFKDLLPRPKEAEPPDIYDTLPRELREVGRRLCTLTEDQILDWFWWATERTRDRRSLLLLLSRVSVQRPDEWDAAEIRRRHSSAMEVVTR